MKLAVTYEKGEIFQHFGHTQQFKVYEIENNEIVGSEILNAGGSGHGALAGFLKEHGVDVLICGGIGGGAKTALAEAGIKLYGGVSGSADEAVKDCLAGKLSFDPDAMCSHHDDHHGHGENCGHGSCADHGGH
ncbi:MAG: NifB/NifX family molybdenum-iron cluster-binding protein [Bacillota bacterium]|nr:NifB/NifX family molybdenum-iron cluster-binding protein [Bacillota bacterium]